ncbi:MAG: virginiamycin lyase [Candidatus Eremiobacteraeota bacterium]|nr:virginiamycin lyase [Candidatus Eremiobacteraeota bacterium]
MFKTFQRAGVLAGVALLLSACSGGGGTHAAGVVPGTGADSAKRAPRTVGAQTRYTPPITPIDATANLGQITGGLDGKLYFAEASPGTNCTPCSGRISQITTGGSITSYGLPNYFDANNTGYPVYPFAVFPAADNKIYFLSDDGFFGSINTDGSSPVVYTLRQLGSDTSGTFTNMTQGADGNFYVSETSPERIIKVTTGGTASVFNSSLSSGANVGSILYNSDGNFWLTERGTGKIGKLTTSGTLTEYDAVSGGGYNPLDIFSDGSNLWYTAQNTTPANGQKLVEMSTSGSILKTISITTSPAGIGALSPQGGTYAWTINANISRVNRSSNAVNDYTLTDSNPGTVLEGLTIGSDGNLWFTDRAHNKIVKVAKQ